MSSTLVPADAPTLHRRRERPGPSSEPTLVVDLGRAGHGGSRGPPRLLGGDLAGLVTAIGCTSYVYLARAIAAGDGFSSLGSRATRSSDRAPTAALPGDPRSADEGVRTGRVVAGPPARRRDRSGRHRPDGDLCVVNCGRPGGARRRPRRRAASEPGRERHHHDDRVAGTAAVARRAPRAPRRSCRARRRAERPPAPDPTERVPRRPAVTVALWRSVGWRRALLSVGVCVLVVSPWVLRNAVVVGAARLVTSDGFTSAAIYGPPALESGGFMDPTVDD